jgi:hypothetical protein
MFPDFYFNQGLLLGKAERYQDAIKALRWYLAAAPTAGDRARVIEFIGELEAGADKAAQQAATQAEAERQRAAAAAEAERQRAAAENAKRLEDERNRAMQSVIQTFRDSVGGRTYEHYFCQNPDFAKELSRLAASGARSGHSSLKPGCNLNDYNGRNWSKEDLNALVIFQFTDKGVIFCRGGIRTSRGVVIRPDLCRPRTVHLATFRE